VGAGAKKKTRSLGRKKEKKLKCPKGIKAPTTAAVGENCWLRRYHIQRKHNRGGGGSEPGSVHEEKKKGGTQ